MNPLLLKLSPITSLFNRSCPSDVTRFVISVVVYAVDGMSGRRWISDALVKGLKVFAPFFTNAYASASIIFVLLASWMVATQPHRLPSFINFRVGHSMSDHLFSHAKSQFMISITESRTANFLDETTAGTAVALPKGRSANPLFISTFASAQPVTDAVFLIWPIFSSRFEPVTNRQFAENHSRHVVHGV
jgi:hypothetical protein